MSTISSFLGYAAVTAALILTTPTTALAANAEGQLDPTFGNAGRVVVPFDVGGGLTDEAHGVAVQADGRIVVAGNVSLDGLRRTGIGLVRLMPDGSIDSSFGTNGKTVYQMPDINLTANQVIVQPDGKILVAGAYTGDNDAHGSIVIRFNADGVGTDSSFTFYHGYLLDPGVDVADDAKPMALAADGSIYLVASIPWNAPVLDEDFKVHKLDANGFGIWSTVLGFNAGGDDDDYAKTVALQADGQVVVAGTINADIGSEFGVARLNASDGQVDTSFGIGGTVTINLTQIGETDCFDDVSALHIQAVNNPDSGTSEIIWIGGTHCVYGGSLTPSGAFAELKDNGDQWLVPFGGHQVNPLQPGYENQHVVDMLLQSTPISPTDIETLPIFVANGNSISYNFNVDMLLNRLGPPGMFDYSPDQSFGTDGFQSVYYNYLGPGNGDDYAHAAALTGTGYMLLVGSVQQPPASGEDSDFTISRVLIRDKVFYGGFDPAPPAP